MRAFIVVVAVLLSLVTALYGVEMSCSYKRNVVWADYDDSLQEQLTCSQSIASYTWWKRNTASYGGIRSDCVLKSDEWNLVQRCSDSSICSVRVDSSTVSLEYCVTSGAVNPAVAMEGSQYLECFDITGVYTAEGEREREFTSHSGVCMTTVYSLFSFSLLLQFVPL